jgi:hypothetical protein
MALAPYMRLAQDALIEGRDLGQMTIDEWEDATRDRFLYQAN